MLEIPVLERKTQERRETYTEDLNAGEKRDKVRNRNPCKRSHAVLKIKKDGKE